MIPRPKCVQYVRPEDKTAFLCAWCPDKARGDEWADWHGYDVSHGICPKCIEHFKADSMKHSPLAFPASIIAA